MYKKKMIVILVGIVCFGIGLTMLKISPDPMEENLEIARQATNAQEAAAAIAANNQKDVFSSTLAYLFVGFGAAMTLGGVLMKAKNRASKENV